MKRLSIIILVIIILILASGGIYILSNNKTTDCEYDFDCENKCDETDENYVNCICLENSCIPSRRIGVDIKKFYSHEECNEVCDNVKGACMTIEEGTSQQGLNRGPCFISDEDCSSNECKCYCLMRSYTSF